MLSTKNHWVVLVFLFGETLPCDLFSKIFLAPVEGSDTVVPYPNPFPNPTGQT